MRRSRGYNFEHSLVQRFNALPDWYARRLGGSSTGLPDIVAINNAAGVLLTIEAKSGTSDLLYVPQDQLERCKLVTQMFAIYPQRHIILAFKFIGKKRFRRNNHTVYEPRKLVAYYKIADSLAKKNPLPIIKCTYGGKTYGIFKSGTIELNLPDYLFPVAADARPNQIVKLPKILARPKNSY